MSFESKTLPVARMTYNTYYASQAVAGGSMFEDLNLSHAFELDKIYLHMSGLHVSVEGFTVVLSHHMGSYFNEKLLSQAMLGLQDVIYQPSRTIHLHYGDTLHFSLVASTSNFWGLEVSGWAITGIPRA